MYDIGIIGAGPAGATLARLLAGRCRVLLLDSGRNKCCGGILAPEAQNMLTRFGLEIPPHVLVQPQPRSVAVLDLQARLLRHYARNYVNIDRHAFDQWLISLIPDTVDIFRNAMFRSSSPSQDGLSIDIRFIQDGQTQVKTVRQLVGADGPFSTVRRENFPTQIFPKRYWAVQHWFDKEIFCRQNSLHDILKNIDFPTDYVGIFDADITDFYAWFIPKSQHVVLGAAISDSDNPKNKFFLLKSKLAEWGLVFPTPEHCEAGPLLRPLTLASMNSGSDRIFLVGEAAGLISPSSAEGIGAALSSAWHLSRSLRNGQLHSGIYRRHIRWLRWNLWHKLAKNPVMFNPWLRQLIMRLGVTAQIYFMRD